MTDDPTDDRYKRGMRTRREVLGDNYVDRAIANATPFTAPFQEFITRVAWGDIWSRPGLDRRTRSCITLAALTVLGNDHELALHVRTAIRNGLSHAEIAEVLLHTAAYAGIPAANRAFSIAADTLSKIAAEDTVELKPGEAGHGDASPMPPRLERPAPGTTPPKRG